MSERSDLDQLLTAAATAPDDRQATDRFVAALLAGNVTWLLGKTDGGALNPITVNRDGRPMVPFFSSAQRLAEVMPSLSGREVVPTAITGRDLFAEAVRNGVATVLNPASSHGKVFVPPEMSDLLAGVVPGPGPRVMPKDTKVAVGAPAEVPDGLLEALTERFAGMPAVEAARLALLRHEDGLETLLLAVHTTLGPEQVMPVIDSVAMTGHRPLDVDLREPGDTAGVADGVEPFYRRAAG